jgi:hypothetical protein
MQACPYGYPPNAKNAKNVNPFFWQLQTLKMGLTFLTFLTLWAENIQIKVPGSNLTGCLMPPAVRLVKAPCISLLTNPFSIFALSPI